MVDEAYAPDICNPRIAGEQNNAYGKPSSSTNEDLPDALTNILNHTKRFIPDFQEKPRQPEQKGPKPEPREPQSPYHPWEDPFFPWKKPEGFDRFTQQMRPTGPGNLSFLPDEDNITAGIRMMKIKSGERILTHGEFTPGHDDAQEKAAIRRALNNPRMNANQPKQRANGSIANWNPKLPDDL